VLVGFVDYIRKLAEVARDEGLLERIGIKMIIGHLGTEDRAATEAAWCGAKAYDWYGVGDTGSIAGEGPDRDGLYIWEDAHFLELLDVDTGQAVTPGSPGDMVVTCLFKDDVAPCIRFNTHDVTTLRTDRNTTGMVFDRIAGFQGRSDNMVKLKGINIFPHAVGAAIENRADLTGEYLCRVRRDGPHDSMEVIIESRGGSDAAELGTLLRQRLGIEVAVTLCEPGGTAAETQIDTRQKPIRLIDERKR
jgi:phenylacetate-CoA ligase